MKKIIALFTVTSMLFMMTTAGICAETGENENTTEVNAKGGSTETGPEEAETAPTGADGSKEEESAITDNVVTTKHEVVIKGRKIAYTAETGSMAVKSGESECEIYYTAYTVDNDKDMSERPITFAFNGGPGASSYYVHIGCFGPRKVELDQRGEALSLPAKLVDNDNSVLDMTDLVFIDPVGTGFSHAVDEDKTDEFLGYDNDVRSVGDFIRQYINRNNRWGSEKYIAGESYGTVRAVGICKYLADTYSIYLNGLMLISSANDYSAFLGPIGNDKQYALLLPTLAADAWYQGCLAKEYQEMELEEFLDEVRSFAENEYIAGLFKGNTLTDDEKEKLTSKIAGYTGLSYEFISEKNIRIELEDFSRELLKDKGLLIGRMDGRITGPVTDGSIDSGENDPSMIATDLAMTNTYLQYLTDELGFQTDIPYVPLSYDVNYAWDYSVYDYQTVGLGSLSQEDMIRECMSKNRFLKIWVICGYYDGATPFYAVEWIFNHVFINDDLKDNLQFSHYPSGHTFYIDKEVFDSFRSDAENWYTGGKTTE